MNSYRKRVKLDAKRAQPAVDPRGFEIVSAKGEETPPAKLELATSPAQSSWYTLQSIALIIERRECKHCKKVTFASAGAMLELKAPAGGSVYVNPKVSIRDLDLPRRRIEVSIPINACEECFKASPAASEAQRGTTHREHTLLGEALSKKQLAELRIKIDAEAAMRSNFYKAPGKKAKEKPPVPKLEDIF